MAAKLVDGRRLRSLTFVDQFNRSCPQLYADSFIGANKVIDALEDAGIRSGRPEAITVDDGPEFAGRVLDAWASQRGIDLDFIRPGKPTENGFIESFNGRLRNERLDTAIFFTLNEVREKFVRWREDRRTQESRTGPGPERVGASLCHGVISNVTTTSFPTGLPPK